MALDEDDCIDVQSKRGDAEDNTRTEDGHWSFDARLYNGMMYGNSEQLQSVKKL